MEQGNAITEGKVLDAAEMLHLTVRPAIVTQDYGKDPDSIALPKYWAKIPEQTQLRADFGTTEKILLENVDPSELAFAAPPLNRS